MTTAALLSVIIPLPDACDGLGATVWSVLRQPEADLEVVLVSPDPSGAHPVARRFTAHEPRVYLTGTPAGGSARDAGLAAARGRYVTFVDCGDVLADGAVAGLVGALEESGSDVAVGWVETFGPAGRAGELADAPRPDHHRGAALADLPDLVARDDDRGLLFRREFLTAQPGKAGRRLAAVRALTTASALDTVAAPVYYRRSRPAGDARALRDLGQVAAWLDETTAAFDVLLADGPAPAAAGFARHALGAGLEPRLAALASADGRLAARAASAFARLAEAAGGVHLRRLASPTRWELALAVLGRPDLVPLVRDPDDRDTVTLEGLDGDLPSDLRTALGLGGATLADGFAARFLQRRPSLTPPHPLPAPQAAAEPEISLVMAVHNVADYVAELMRSLRAITDVALEIIVVDDSSTDATWQALEECAALDPRIRPVRSPGRGGGQARNHGVELARGEYLAFADGDDVVPPHAYSAMLAAARRTGADVVTGSYLKLFTNSTWDPSRRYGYGVAMDAVRLVDHPQLATHRACWNRLFRREFWLANALPFPGVPRSNDVVAVTSALTAAERITLIPDVTYVYRARPGASSMTAGLGLAEPTISYLSEEATCARLVAQLDDPAVTAEYWSMVLEGDALSHLRPYLAARRAAGDPATDEVPRWHAALLALAPEASLRELRPELRSLHALVAAGRVDAAATLAAASRREDLPPVGEVLDALAAAPGAPGVDTDLLGRLVRRYLVDRLVAEPEALTPEVADRAVELTRALAREHDARPPAAPSEPEHRVVSALLGGTGADLAAVLTDHKGPKATLRAGLRGVRVEAALGRRSSGIRSIAATPAQTPQAAQFPLGRVEVDGERWHADLLPDAVPAPGRWTLLAEIEDAWGLHRVALRLSGAGLRPPFDKLSRFAPVKGAGASGEVWIRSAAGDRVGALLAKPARKARRLFSRGGLQAVRRRLRLG